ncbi:Srb6p SCDLUD_002480 [Saccharomycodes ludwigii]|uniref:Srb6p n=1 Tax=Saccharomycodes ludwigii TaxID=36035 RepID=UPI001E87A8FA|nr:hypothetical protein SCDLUD_002480 [Saccharomycodes ludwigii]KAH3901014.1 hypothetical protein SCDLUD_002480 [Saccharomycodes ludwigii]
METSTYLDKVNKIGENLMVALENIIKYSNLSTTLSGAKEEDAEEKGESDDEEKNQHDEDFNDTDENLIVDSTDGLIAINEYTMQLITGVQELLLISRNIRERWILGSQEQQLVSDTGLSNITENESNPNSVNELDILNKKSALLLKAVDELIRY